MPLRVPCRTVQPGYEYYVCRAKGDPIVSGHETPCPARYVPAQQLDEVVWQDLCALLTAPEHIAQALARAQGGGWLPQELQARREQLHKARAVGSTSSSSGSPRPTCSASSPCRSTSAAAKGWRTACRP